MIWEKGRLLRLEKVSGVWGDGIDAVFFLGWLLFAFEIVSQRME
jgi:hypothetical protein